MTNLIKLTGAYDNEEFYMNPSYIVQVYSSGEGSALLMAAGLESFRVKETPERIAQLCSGPAPTFVIPPMPKL